MERMHRRVWMMISTGEGGGGWLAQRGEGRGRGHPRECGRGQRRWRESQGGRKCAEKGEEAR